MATSEFTTEQILSAPCAAEGGTPGVEICPEPGLREPMS
jgi:hypothetical protein